MRAFVCFEEFADLPAEEAALLAAQAAKERGSTVRAYPMSFAKGFTEFYRKKFGGKILPTKYTDANRFLKNGAYGVGEDYGVLSVGDLLPIEDTLIKDPLCGTSYGLGEVVKNLLVLKKKRVVIALPEGCFFDLGVGFLSALGGKFFNADGEAFLPTAESLSEIRSYDLTEPKKALDGVGIELYVDKNRSLVSAVSDASAFGTRKTDQEVLKRNIDYLVSQTDVFEHYPDFDGAGEGGGFCYMAVSFFHATVRPFFDLVSDDIADGIASCDAVISGRIGCFSSSVASRTISSVAALAAEKNKPVFLLSDDGKDGGIALFSPDRTRKENRALLPQTLRDSLDGIFSSEAR